MERGDGRAELAAKYQLHPEPDPRLEEPAARPIDREPAQQVAATPLVWSRVSGSPSSPLGGCLHKLACNRVCLVMVRVGQ